MLVNNHSLVIVCVTIILCFIYCHPVESGVVTRISVKNNGESVVLRSRNLFYELKACVADYSTIFPANSFRRTLPCVVGKTGRVTQSVFGILNPSSASQVVSIVDVLPLVPFIGFLNTKVTSIVQIFFNQYSQQNGDWIYKPDCLRIIITDDGLLQCEGLSSSILEFVSDGFGNNLTMKGDPVSVLTEISVESSQGEEVCTSVTSKDTLIEKYYNRGSQNVSFTKTFATSNTRMTAYSTSMSSTVQDTYKAGIDVGVEAEAGVVFAKAKTSLKLSFEYTRTDTRMVEKSDSGSTTFSNEETTVIQIDNLTPGLSASIYKSLVTTTCDKPFTGKFEIFYIDFGLSEVVDNAIEGQLTSTTTNTAIVVK